MSDFEGLDVLIVSQRQIDGVQAFEQALSRKRIDGESLGHALRIAHRTRVEVHGDAVFLVMLGVLHDVSHQVRRKRDGQDAVLVAVLAEDIGKTRCNDGAKPVIEEGPRRVLA